MKKFSLKHKCCFIIVIFIFLEKASTISTSEKTRKLQSYATTLKENSDSTYLTKLIITSFDTSSFYFTPTPTTIVTFIATTSLHDTTFSYANNSLLFTASSDAYTTYSAMTILVDHSSEDLITNDTIYTLLTSTASTTTTSISITTVSTNGDFCLFVTDLD